MHRLIFFFFFEMANRFKTIFVFSMIKFEVLRSGLTVESACRYLVFADMHSAQDLKLDALRFIAQNSASIISVIKLSRYLVYAKFI